VAEHVLRNLVDIEDFVRGCTFMGTGGGGQPEAGVQSLKNEMDRGNTIKWVDAGTIGDDEWTICPFLMGSIAPVTERLKKEMRFFGLTKEVYTQKEMLAEAVKALAAYHRVKVGAVVPIELGGANTAGAIGAGISLGLSVVDGDYTGRAIPEAPQTTPYLAGKPMWPMASVDAYGNRVFITEAVSYGLAERLGKKISEAAFGLAGQSGFLIKGREMKEVVVPGTLTMCHNIGRTIRETREKGKDPVTEVTRMLGGWILLRGTVSKKEDEDRDGYYWGTHTFAGEGPFRGTELKIWFKNENHICWKDGQPFITSPDLLIVVDDETGEPYTNTKIVEGMKVAVICLKAVPLFRSEKGLDILGASHFGFDIPYRPAEEVLGVPRY